MKVLIMPNMGKQEAIACTKQVVKVLHKNGMESCLDISNREAFPIEHVSFADLSTCLSMCDVIAVIGGDGTIIGAAKAAITVDKPIFGINLGRMGYLAQINPNELETLVKLKEGKYRLEERMLLETKVTNGGTKYAVNDIVISRGILSKIADISVLCDEKPMINYRSDGIIISTPTGSTAYSLSAGGSVVDPIIECILLTPICPHSLSSRSLILSPERELTVISKTRNQDSDVYVSCDGEFPIKLNYGESVTVKKSDKKVKFLRFDDASFYDIVSEKLMNL